MRRLCIQYAVILVECIRAASGSFFCKYAGSCFLFEECGCWSADGQSRSRVGWKRSRRIRYLAVRLFDKLSQSTVDAGKVETGGRYVDNILGFRAWHQLSLLGAVRRSLESLVTGRSAVGISSTPSYSLTPVLLVLLLLLPLPRPQRRPCSPNISSLPRYHHPRITDDDHPLLIILSRHGSGRLVLCDAFA